jgi:hypothetical protein
MKEVTLFSDDPKSKESAKQLGQVLCFQMCFAPTIKKISFMLLYLIY